MPNTPQNPPAPQAPVFNKVLHPVETNNPLIKFTLADLDAARILASKRPTLPSLNEPSGLASVALQLPPEGITPDIAKAPQKPLPCKFVFHAFEILHRRTNHPLGGGTDTVKIMCYLTVGKTVYSGVLHDVGDVGDTGIWYGMNVGFYNIPVLPTDHISFSFGMMNAGHKSDAEVEAAMGQINDQANKLAIQEATSGGIWGIVGAAAIEISKWLVDEFESLSTADCDGVLAVDAFSLTGQQVIGGWNHVGDYPGIGSNPGCGGNSHYKVACYAEYQYEHFDHLDPGVHMMPGDHIVSKSGDFRCNMQKDGNLVVTNHRLNEMPLWSAQINGPVKWVLMQKDDGNLVIYEPDGSALWYSNTAGHPGSKLIMQDDGNLVIYQGSNPTWAAASNFF